VAVGGQLQRSVGRNVRRLRLARGESQEDFAAALHLHRTYLGAIERGERNLTLKTVEGLADRLGVDPWDLIGRREDAAGDEPATRPARTRRRTS
jgi:transcriptional regulator with XRE-family HTH domain